MLHHEVFETTSSYHKIYNYFIELNSLKLQQQIQITLKFIKIQLL